MKKTIILYLVLVGFTAIAFWIFFASINFLTCKSLARFDNAKTKMTALGICYASINGGEYFKAVK